MPAPREKCLDDYLYKYEMQTRLLDQSGGHLNNTSFFVLFENATNMFCMEHGLYPDDADFGRLVRVAQTEFNSVVNGWPYPVTVGIGCRRLGGSSVEVEFAMFQDTEDARAIGTQVHVFMNKNTGRPDPQGINPELRAAYEKMIAHAKARDAAAASESKL